MKFPPTNLNRSGFGQQLLPRSVRAATIAVFAALNFAPVAQAVSPDVVISQVYGGGGNTGATYKNDFIELYNRGSSAVSLNGMSVQYASATGSSWTNKINLTNVSLLPGQYYLIQGGAGTGGTTNLPTPDATSTINLSGTTGKVALVSNTTALTGTCPTTGVVDFIGFGTNTTTVNCSESSPAPLLSNTTADLRNNSGSDTDNNSADFTAGAPNPRNTSVSNSTIVNGACGTANGQTVAVAPTTNLCATGTATAVSGTGPWAWTCASTTGGTTASCAASKTVVSTANPFTIFHMNDVHARITPHQWVISQHSKTQAGFEAVGGAAYLAGKMLDLTTNKPNSLVLDGGDISEGNPLGDMNGNVTGTYGNGGLTTFYSMMANKLKLVAGRNGRGIDALVVGNHDVRDVSYITNMEAMVASSGIPVISANVRDITTHQPHFPATTTVTVNGTKIGIVGYTTPSAVVGASLASTIEVVQCDWKGTIASGCHIADYVNDLRNVQHCDVVILLTHDGHSNLVDPAAPVLADTADAKVPEIAVTGHWHTWSETVWQPVSLNYKTIFTESASYMKYIGELNVNGDGSYVSATQHVLRNADIVPDQDVINFVSGLEVTYNNANPGHPVDEVVGYSNSNLMLDNNMKWWSADEYPWNGNNTAGQWITDAMQWKCAILFGQCDLAVEAGGGVRADIPAGAVTFKQVYETFPWADDTYYRVNMSGQDIMNFLKATNMDAGFSSAMDVTAVDGIPTSVKINGTPIDLAHTYTVGINNYMYQHPPAGYLWTDAAPLTSTVLVRESLADFMRQVHPTAATAYQIGGDRYHLNGEYSGGYRVVVTMMNDNEAKLTFEDAFIRFVSANPETLARRGSNQVPTSLVNADGSINPNNRFSEQELYRSFLGFKTGALKQGDIIEVWGKASFFGGNPEFVDQEGIYADKQEFKIVGHDDSLAKPVYVSSINGFLNDNYKNHYVQFLAKKSATANTVTDQFSQSLKIWDVTGYTAKTLPGASGDTLLMSGVVTMESYGFRFRCDNVAISSSPLPTVAGVSSHVNPLSGTVSAPITLTATTNVGGGTYILSPMADTQVASGSPASNYGTSNNLFIQSSSTNSFGNERAWLKFDLSTIPAGSTVTGASLQLWDWKAAGAAMPVEARSAATDTWTETGLNWSNQPALGSVLDTQTLAATTDLWYSWNVTAFVQAEFSGDKTASLMLKPVTENSADTTVPSYGFDAKEYGSNAPVLQVTTTQTGATSVGSVKYFYRYSVDNATWSAWTQWNVVSSGVNYPVAFNFPGDIKGYYEFYSVATDNLNNAEPTPAYAQAAVHYDVASGSTQSVSNFTAPTAVTAGNTFTLAATASSGLSVTYSSSTPGVCTVSGNVVTAVATGTCTLVADQSGDLGYFLSTSLSQSFNIAAAVVTGTSTTVPVPNWAIMLLAAGLLGTMRKLMGRRR